MQVDFSKTIEDGGGYDLSEIKQARESLGNQGNSNQTGYEDVEPLYIPVKPNEYVARTEEFEARVVIVEYNEYDEIVGVELL